MEQVKTIEEVLAEFREKYGDRENNIDRKADGEPADRRIVADTRDGCRGRRSGCKQEKTRQERLNIANSNCPALSSGRLLFAKQRRVLMFTKDRIRQIRKTLGMTQGEFGKRIVISTSYLAEMESGDKNKYDILLSEVFIEKTRGGISREIFSNLSEQYNQNIQRLKNERFQTQLRLNELRNILKNVNKFIKIVDNLDFICDNELTEKFVHSVVDKVVVHERAVKGSLEQPDVDIFFAGVGDIDFSLL